MRAPTGAFADLAERHRPAILAYLQRLVGDTEDAQEACQEAMLRACRSFARLPPGSNVRAWLYKIATRCGLTRLRQRRRWENRLVEVDIDGVPARELATIERREELRLVARGVRALPPKQRAALMQRRFQGLPYEEIGAALGCSADSARANVYQAVRKLRRVLEES